VVLWDDGWLDDSIVGLLCSANLSACHLNVIRKTKKNKNKNKELKMTKKSLAKRKRTRKTVGKILQIRKQK